MDGKRGRKGQFGGIVPLAPWNEGDYPSPPKDLPEPEAATWKNTVRAMKPRWFHPACFPMLRSYCFTVWASEQLATKLRTATIDEGAADLLDPADADPRHQAEDHPEIKPGGCLYGLRLTSHAAPMGGR